MKAFVKKIAAAFFFTVAVAVLSSCEKPPAPETPAQPPPAQGPDLNLPPATVGAWQQGGADLQRTEQAAKTFSAAVKTLLDTPNGDNLASARADWHAMHNSYQRFAVFLSLARSNPGLFGQLETLNSPLDTWPIAAGYLDYFDVYTHSGIVNDIAIPITAEAVRRQHGFSDVSDVSLGMHAIAYLLWGEHGKRPLEDFVKKEQLEPKQRSTGLSVIDLPNNRRRTLLTLMCNLLLDDLRQMRLAWTQKIPGSLQQHYLALSPDSRLQLLQIASVEFISSELLANRLAPLLNTARADEIHNRFAGGDAAALAASVDGLRDLLINPKQPQNGLVNWLFEEPERQAFLQQFAAAEQLLGLSPPADAKAAVDPQQVSDDGSGSASTADKKADSAQSSNTRELSAENVQQTAAQSGAADEGAMETQNQPEHSKLSPASGEALYKALITLAELLSPKIKIHIDHAE